MIDKGYVPVKRTALFSMISKYKLTGICDDECHLSGRKPVMNVKSLNTSINQYFEHSGRAINSENIIGMSMDSKQKKIVTLAI